MANKQKSIRKPIGIKILIVIMMVVLLQGVALFVVTGKLLKAKAIENTKEDMQAIMVGLQETLKFLAAKNEFNQIQKTVTSLAANLNVNQVLFFDDSSNVVAATSIGSIGRNIDDLLDHEIRNALINHSDELKTRLKNILWESSDGESLYAISPVELGRSSVKSLRTDKIGILFLHYRMGRIDKKNQLLLQESFVPMMFMLMLAGVGLVIYFNLSISRRIKTVHNAATAFSEGNYDVRTKLTGNDEITNLGQAFNMLAQEVQENRDMLQRRENSLADTLIELRQMRQVVEKSPIVVFRWRAAEGYPVELVSSNVEQFGYTAEELLSGDVPYTSIIHPDDYKSVTGELEDCTANGATEVQQQYRIVSPDGDVHWADDHTTIVRDTDGHSLYYQGTVTDITERKKLEDKLLTLAQVVEQSPESIVITNVAAEIEYVNQAFIETSGYSWEEVSGGNPSILRSGKTSLEVYQFMWRELTQGNTWTGELTNKRKDGTEYIEYAIISPIKALDGSISHYVAVKQDVTEKNRMTEELINHRFHLETLVEQRTQELEETKLHAEVASQAKTMFLANMSHEIRTPLTAIIGFSKSLMTERFDHKQQCNVIETIIRNCEHLHQIINDILDLSKIEADQLEIEQISCSPIWLISEVDSLLGMKVRDKGLGFKVNYHFPLLAKIQTDPTRLKQILINLLNNALKFTEAGEVVMDVSWDEKTTKMQFKIQDTGPGLTAEEIDHVFNPFTQADATTTRNYGGTGLGLPISSRLARELGGDLTCVSKKGQGCCFILSIATHCPDDVVPINRLEDVSILHDEHFAQAEIKPLAGHILLAEDSPDNQQLISMYIRKTGAELTVVENGREAVDMALVRNYDLILMDMQMPVMDGLQAIVTLRSKGYLGTIVSLTANALMSDREKCLSAGADGYLIKPINLLHFYEILNTYLAESKDKGSSEHLQVAKMAFINDPKYRELIERFLQNLPQEVKKLSDAIDAKDWDVACAVSHDLKGMGGAMGYPLITEISSEINTLAKRQEYKQVGKAFAKLEKISKNILEQDA